MTQYLTRVVLIKVKEICLFGLLGVALPNSQFSPEEPEDWSVIHR
jgi:hypothetical protein